MTFMILDCNHNFIKGTIPQDPGRLKKLKILRLADLHNNNLQGEIPSSLFSISTLRVLDFNNNNLNGSLPISINNGTRLEELYLHYNSFIGEIPSFIWNMPSLRIVTFDVNHLKGNLPDEICHQLPLLESLDVGGNQLEGSIPQSITNCTSLKGLYFGDNSFTGINLHNLKKLSLEQNELTGPIPKSLSNASKLIALGLSSNKFNGAVPIVLGNLTNMMDLVLDDNDLTGFIPNTLNKLHSLQRLNLTNNILQGSIINELCQLKSLSELYLANNMFSGIIPGCSGNTSLRKLDFSSNKLISHIPYSLWSLEDILYLDISSNALSGMISPKHKRAHDNYSTTSHLVNLGTPIRISYYELLQGTNGFDESNLLGSGSFGSVYKATLSNEEILAVKVFNLDMEEVSRSFDIECVSLRNLRHRNLIKIISSCSNDHFKSLIMEFMENGSLDRWLYSHNYYLDILQRLNIMIDVALALEYLHHGSPTLVVHCDVKPSNVLLDKDMVAHLSDFGISKLFCERQLEIYTKTLATIGYMAPV
ncbi:hypothetical protein K1719_043924 [Acacia pycnantha]|nr:hypothetical protein K1719_043924 [Acacia pycnantha]